MNKSTNNILYTALAGIVLFSSCSSDDEKVLPQLNDNHAKSTIATIAVAPGAKVFFDFKTNSPKDSAQSMVNLSGMYGSSLKNSRPDTYKMGYFDKVDSNLETLKLDNILAQELHTTDEFTIDASSAGAPATGATWIIYDFKNNHAVYPTPDRFIVLYKGTAYNKDADELYVLNAGSITAAQGSATYTIHVKEFIKK